MACDRAPRVLPDGEGERARARAHTEPPSRGRGRTIGIYGEFGIGNAGNDESARTLVALLRERGHHDIVAVTLNARRTVAEGMPAVQLTSSSRPSRFLPVRVAAKAAGKGGDLVRLIRIVRELGAVIVPAPGSRPSSMRSVLWTWWSPAATTSSCRSPPRCR